MQVTCRPPSAQVYGRDNIDEIGYLKRLTATLFSAIRLHNKLKTISKGAKLVCEIMYNTEQRLTYIFQDLLGLCYTIRILSVLSAFLSH